MRVLRGKQAGSFSKVCHKMTNCQRMRIGSGPDSRASRPRVCVGRDLQPAHGCTQQGLLIWGRGRLDSGKMDLWGEAVEGQDSLMGPSPGGSKWLSVL